jgi:hypothetical protein
VDHVNNASKHYLNDSHVNQLVQIKEKEKKKKKKEKGKGQEIVVIYVM